MERASCGGGEAERRESQRTAVLCGCARGAARLSRPRSLLAIAGRSSSIPQTHTMHSHLTAVMVCVNQHVIQKID
eukprot:COSAG01_NODE_3990_length_5458_cov_2.452323_12_plen_75_part_00